MEQHQSTFTVNVTKSLTVQQRPLVDESGGLFYYTSQFIEGYKKLYTEVRSASVAGQARRAGLEFVEFLFLVFKSIWIVENAIPREIIETSTNKLIVIVVLILIHVGQLQRFVPRCASVFERFDMGLPSTVTNR